MTRNFDKVMKRTYSVLPMRIEESEFIAGETINFIAEVINEVHHLYSNVSRLSYDLKVFTNAPDCMLWIEVRVKGVYHD